MSSSIHAPQNAPRAATLPSAASDVQQADSPTSYITSPLLHISGVDCALTDKELAGSVFQHVLPVRLKLDRSDRTANGTIEFESLAKAEKAYATIRPPVQLRMSTTSADPVAEAKPRLVKHLPPQTDESVLYDLFRPFGPIYRAECVVTNNAGHHTGFKGVAVVEFYSEYDAQRAQDKMHCVDVEGSTISVVVDNSTAKRAIVGAQVTTKSMSAGAPAFAPAARNVSSGSQASMHAPKSQASAPQISGPAAAVDPCNLFIKNLDADIDSDQLFKAFRGFGRIVSARVMSDASGKSRQFGFVSYTASAEASRAIQAMDNTVLGSKTITVCVHEPKSVRQEKLAARFGPEASTVADPPASHTVVPVQRSVSNTSSNADNVSIISTAAASAKERERLLKAVTSVCETGAPVEDITDMLASLSRKDRALCLFNPEVLSAKIDEAREILEITDDSAEDMTPATPAEGDVPVSLVTQKTPLTLSELAALPASEILQLANLPPSTANAGLPLPKPDADVLKATDEFIDSLANKAPQDQKQKLGDQLFKKIRTFGVKGAPKITIHLLDTEDLRSLAHLMNSYEVVLREKVLQIGVPK